MVGDGPVGPVGRQLDDLFGLPENHHARDWAVGMKFVVDLPQDTPLKPGTVLHTFGYPEPEIFGFFYVHPDRVASLGIFVPSWFDSPVRTTYRYLQHWMTAPLSLAFSQGRQTPLLGRQNARRIRPPRRAPSGRRRLCAHRRRQRQHQHPDRIGRGRSLGHRRATGRMRCSNCSRPGNLSPRKISKRPTSNAAAPVGWKRRRAPPKNRATVFNAASSPA